MHKITRIIQQPIGTNCYIIADEKGCILIDPGSEIDMPEIKKHLTGELYAVILTHLHYDHSAAAYLFDVPVYIHRDELEDLGMQKAIGQRALGKPLQLPEKFAFLGANMKFGDISFEVLHTPGHTKGGVCLVFEEFIITGDTLFAQTYGRTDIGGNEDDMILSLVKLAKLHPDLLVLPGHGEPTTIGAEQHWIEQLEKETN